MKNINNLRRWLIFISVNTLPMLLLAVFFMLKAKFEATGKSIAVCIMHDFLKLYCPACGGTRAVRAILALKPIEALKYNPTVVLAFIYFLYYDLCAFINIIKKRARVINRIPLFVPISLLAMLIGFWILRNVLWLYFKVDFIGDFR